MVVMSTTGTPITLQNGQTLHAATTAGVDKQQQQLQLIQKQQFLQQQMFQQQIAAIQMQQQQAAVQFWPNAAGLQPFGSNQIILRNQPDGTQGMFIQQQPATQTLQTQQNRKNK